MVEKQETPGEVDIAGEIEIAFSAEQWTRMERKHGALPKFTCGCGHGKVERCGGVFKCLFCGVLRGYCQGGTDSLACNECFFSQSKSVQND